MTPSLSLCLAATDSVESCLAGEGDNWEEVYVNRFTAVVADWTVIYFNVILAKGPEVLGRVDNFCSGKYGKRRGASPITQSTWG